MDNDLKELIIDLFCILLIIAFVGIVSLFINGYYPFCKDYLIGDVVCNTCKMMCIKINFNGG